MKKLIVFVLICSAFALFPFQSFAQDGSDFSVSFKGFVKLDAMFDSRQTVTAREGHFLLYPAAEVKDANGDDVNDKANFNMLAVQTRLTTVIKGPDAFGAKTSGVVEGAFFGHSNADINGFRLRHAFVKLAWENTSMTFGQTWNPLFVTACFPGVVSFNTGVPFQPFARNPQIRLEQNFGGTKLIAALYSQRDFTSPGGSTSLRNNVIPTAHVQLQFKAGDHVFGAGVDYKSLVPKIVTASGLKTDQSIVGTSFIGYGALKFGDTKLKFEGIYGQNLFDLLMLGGYATSKVNGTTGDEEEYTPYNNLSLWTELVFGGNFEKGIFVGYSKNNGTTDDIAGATYARGTTIDNLFRVAPRLVWKSGKTRFATEFEYTSAAYGTPDIKGKVKDTTAVSNLRVLFAVYYFFNS